MEPCELSARQARKLIGTRALSPVELLRSCIARIERANPDVNAFVTLCLDRATDEASKAEQAVMSGKVLGRLHGLPLGIKDLEETEGIATTYGSTLYRDNVPKHDRRNVARLRRAGAIVVGKTNTPAFGTGANTTNELFGPTRNPFDHQRVAGGSSGGSAVALACSMVPLCTGGDTGGSLRVPAAYCGIASHRAGPGVVPNEKRVIGMAPFSVLGPMARDVDDVGLMLSVMAEHDPYDPLSYDTKQDFARIPEIDPSDLRVAFSTDLGVAEVDNGIRADFAAACRSLGEMLPRSEIADPPLHEARTCNRILRGIYYLARHAELYETEAEAIDPIGRAIYEDARRLPITDIAAAPAMMTRIHAGMVEFFTRFDLLICPVVAVAPMPIEQSHVTSINDVDLPTNYDWLALTWALTVAENPVVTIPFGLDGTGMPFGLQLVGAYGQDRALLGMARAIERALDNRPIPRLPE